MRAAGGRQAGPQQLVDLVTQSGPALGSAARERGRNIVIES